MLQFGSRLFLLCCCLLGAGLAQADAAASATSGAAAIDAPDSGWRLSMDRDNVRVWKRNEPGSEFLTFRAETIVHAPVSALLALFYDLDAAPQWLDHTRRVTALQRDDVNHSYTMLIQTSMPWPLKDRDAVIVGHWWQDPANHVVYMRGKAAPRGAYPENPDYLRYYDLRNDWTFVPTSDGNVRVIMEGHADPGGYLPSWAVNMLIQQSPFKTLQNMRNMVAADRYQKAHMQDVNQTPSRTTVATLANNP
jgi:hypothetical protein